MLSGTGTMPARMAPRNTIGKSTVSSMIIATRSSRRTPRRRSMLASAAALLLQIAIGQFGNRVGEGEFVAAAFIDIAVEQPGHRVVGTGLAAHAALPVAQACHDAFSPVLRIIIHRKALRALAVNPRRHYVSDTRRSRPEPNGDMTETPDPETGFLEQLGQRVRTMRALRGMSRKVLAKVSGISERYIAQLESGKGNVSIVLLRRVSNAMGAHLEDLIPASRAGAGLAGASATSCARRRRARSRRPRTFSPATARRRSGGCRLPASP